MADRATFAEDTRPFRRPLFSRAVRLTTNHSDAEDLVQETYLRAYRSYGTFRPGTNLRAWMFRILTNAHINRYRARERRPEETALDELEDGFAAVGADVASPHGRSAEDELLDDLSMSEVLEAVEALPNAYGETVLLADVEGFSYREIADRLGVPIGTVMSRLHRGRRALRDKLEGRMVIAPTA
ncbi:MAG: sigma-70 family RNA polymerase sigma factor [Actinomycetota bacterium]